MSKRARLLLLAERFAVFVAAVTVLAFAYLWHATLERPSVAPSAAETDAAPSVAETNAAPSATDAAVGEPLEPLAPELVDELAGECRADE